MPGLLSLHGRWIWAGSWLPVLCCLAGAKRSVAACLRHASKLPLASVGNSALGHLLGWHDTTPLNTQHISLGGRVRDAFTPRISAATATRTNAARDSRTRRGGAAPMAGRLPAGVHKQPPSPAGHRQYAMYWRGCSCRTFCCQTFSTNDAFWRGGGVAGAYCSPLPDMWWKPYGLFSVLP